MLNCTRGLMVHRDMDPLLRALVVAAPGILEAERCTVFLLDKEKNELWSPIATGGQTIRFPAGKGIAGETIATNKLINIPDAYADARFNPGVDRTTGFRTRNILTAPLTPHQGAPLGALQMLNKKKGRTFDEDDEKILSLFAGQAAAAVETAQLYDDLEAAYSDTVYRLAAAAEHKDEGTRNHLERVSRFSELIAQTAKLPREWTRRLLLASPMHDIGKIGVPDAVLRKPGALNPLEWDEIKKHPMYGKDILANSNNELLKMSERIAVAHHEKWDGTGYPLGLKGDDIPLEARVVAIADVFDAVTSPRCYKPAFTLEDAVKIIEDGSGKSFDPKLVAAFKKSVPAMIKIMKQFADMADNRTRD